MTELEEVNCEIRNTVDIQHSIANRLSNAERDEDGSLNGSQVFNGIDGVCGGFLNGAAYAWLSHGCHLVVINTKTGESTSSWSFRGRITCVCQFPTQSGELPLLLVGLDNEATRIKDSMGLLCIFDCTTSRVLRAIRMPAGVEQVCIVSGGAEWEEFNDKRPDNILMQMDGIACVVLCNLHHLMIDLRRSSWETADLSAAMDENSPAEIEFLTTKDSYHRSDTKHMACNLLNRRIEGHIGFNREDFESNAFLDEKLTNTIISSTKIGCLISGCLGRVIIWQNDGSVGWISLPVDETMVVTHLALLEPTDDPRPFYYLLVVFQDESLKVPPLLRMFALLFERKYCDRGTNLYFNLEAEPSLKFEFELNEADRVVSLSTIERGSNSEQTESESKRGEDNLLLISATTRTLLFDLNQWYKEQMPQTITECKNPNSIIAYYDTKPRPATTKSDTISCTYIPKSLQEFPNSSLSSSEELFYPNSLALEWAELRVSKINFWLTRGVQAELLRELALTGPIILTQPSELFRKCLSVGLIPFNTEVSVASDINVQRDTLLSLCLEQRWATFLIRCANEWSDGSAAYMYNCFLKWGIQRASMIKMVADRLCVPLFDQSGSNIGELEVKTLRFCYQQLECLSNVVAKLPFETSSLIKQRRALRHVSMYFQVLLWFHDVGLLPESQSLEEGPLPISLALKIPYPYEKLSALYKEKRASIKDDKVADSDEELLFIDELIARETSALNLQWEREAGDTNTNGYYPPPSLQSLLRSYLTDCEQPESHEIECKHQITIYLLMDLAMLLQGSYPGVDQLIKYPSSFKMSPSLIKLTQAFWLLDHEDYQGFLDMMTGQLVSDSDVKDWHHKLVLRTLIRNSQHKLALMYLRIKKPPLSSFQEQSTLIGLSVEHGLVQSAFHRRPQSHYAQLLLCFFQACKNYDKLGDILHLALDSEEEEIFVKFLEESKSEDVRLLYYLQRCRYMEANSRNSIAWFNNLGSRSLHTDMLNAYNATLPDVVKKFSMNMAKTNLDSGLAPRYPRPMTHHKSTQKTGSIYETVIKKARETYFTEDKFAVPFITAPCSTLNSNHDRININHVTSPKVIQNRKRTLDQVAASEEDSGMRTPDRTKRRKLLEDNEAALSAAFSTPLVKCKVSSVRDAPTETPHSILKIRQMIRSSTSPTLSTLQGDFCDSPVSDRDRKLTRQIRFSINQSKRNSSNSEEIHEEEEEEEELPKVEASRENEEVFESLTVSEKSLTESAVLSDSSSICKNVYTARPRPSLRRSYLQTSTESVNESLSNCVRPRSSINSRLSVSPVTTRDNCTRIASKTTPQASRRGVPLLSASIHSPAILSPGSSFETQISSRRSIDSDFLRIIGQQNSSYNRIGSSTPLIKSSIPEYSRRCLSEPADAEEEEEEEEEQEDIVPEAFHVGGTKLLQGSRHFNNLQYLREDSGSKYRNGDVSKGKALEVEEEKEDVEEEEEETEEFESFVTETDSIRSESKERSHWSLRKPQKEERREAVGENLENGEHFDITDDESSNSGDEIIIALDEQRHESKMQAENIYDAANITDDESDSSIEIINDADKIAVASEKQQTIRNGSRFSSRSEEEVAEKRKSKEESVQLDNNNSSYRKTRRNSIRESREDLEALNDSNLHNESVETGSRITRSRRASSIAKELNVSHVSSPSKASSRNTRSKRASSLVKEVLIASVAVADESLKRTASSGSEESSGTSSPRRSTKRRASSVSKETFAEEQSEEPKLPVRRTVRRAASVQKELPETPKPLAKSRRVLSTSSIAIKEDTEKKKKPSTAAGVKKSSRMTTRSRKDSTANEAEVEDSIATKSPRRRSSSVPKETVSAGRTRRANSVAKEIIAEEDWTQVELAVNSPAVNTRSRRSSIQSVPEELEEILSVPTKERVSAAAKKKTTQSSQRQRRAASVELPQADTMRRTRSTRNRGIFEETIVEEATEETQDPVDEKRKRGTAKGKKPVSPESPVQEESEATPKPRRTKKPTKQESKEKETEQFWFSQPEKADDSTVDRKAIGEVPKYMFSPPHTRSKTVAPNHRRRVNSFIPIASEDQSEQEENNATMEKQEPAKRSTAEEKSGHYIRVILHRYRTKFVLPKRSKSTSN